MCSSVLLVQYRFPSSTQSAGKQCTARARRAAPRSRRAQGERAPPDHVARCGSEREEPIDARTAAVSQLSDQSDGLHPAKDSFDTFPDLMADAVAPMSRRSGVDRAAAVIRSRVLGHGAV